MRKLTLFFNIVGILTCFCSVFLIFGNIFVGIYGITFGLFIYGFGEMLEYLSLINNSLNEIRNMLRNKETTEI